MDGGARARVGRVEPARSKRSSTRIPIRVERYALWEDSAGAGKYRGGMGVVRDYRMLADDIVVSLSSERQHLAARGMAGGGPGRTGAFVLDPDTPRERRLPSAAAEIAMPRGAVLRICTPAGGGYGDRPSAMRPRWSATGERSA